jgi:hypothetical protein
VSVRLRIDRRGRARLPDLDARYRRLSEDPARCLPMVIIHVPVDGLPTWEQRLADPRVMLEAELAELEPHLEMEDDRSPSVRIEFGTAQVAAAFGCAMFQPENNLPCAGSHALTRATDAYDMPLPDAEAGWYARAWEWTAEWRSALPDWIRFDLPDIQSPFNSAHLIRGNDILTDFYDEPAAVERLLDLVTDFMLKIVEKAWTVAGEDRGWLTDWGALWKGRARISNCSMHMISPEFYRRFVLPRDSRFLRSVGGGRVHYCGSHPEVIHEYFRLPMLTGLDYDWSIHDPALVDQCPPGIALTSTIPLGPDSPLLSGMLAGRWPAKRDIIIQASAPSVREGRDLLRRLRKGAGY